MFFALSGFLIGGSAQRLAFSSFILNPRIPDHAGPVVVEIVPSALLTLAARNEL